MGEWILGRQDLPRASRHARAHWGAASGLLGKTRPTPTSRHVGTHVLMGDRRREQKGRSRRRGAGKDDDKKKEAGQAHDGRAAHWRRRGCVVGRVEEADERYLFAMRFFVPFPFECLAALSPSSPPPPPPRWPWPPSPRAHL